MTTRERIILNEIKARVQQCDPTAEVILFGSRARGDFHDESDWDVLIVTDRDVDRVYKDKIRDVLFEIQLNFDTSIDSLFRQRQDWQQPTAIPVYNEIKKEGIRL